MEDIKINVKELAAGWEQLRTELKNHKKIKFELFNDVFSKTYSLLAQQAAENMLDKQYLALVISASLFASTESRGLESDKIAALVLTERMLNHVLFSDAAASDPDSAIYILEFRKDIRINFKDVDESIQTLTRFYENDFWRRQIGE